MLKLRLDLVSEIELGDRFDFDPESLAGEVAEATLASEGCDLPCQVHVTLTDDEGIHEVNLEYRQVDSPTDVLSFPNLEFTQGPADFVIPEEAQADCFDPETGELNLGDILLNVDRVCSQALEYGHSRRREFAFLIAHSMLHLCGYDHMEEEQRLDMESRQEAILQGLGITRET